MHIVQGFFRIQTLTYFDDVALKLDSDLISELCHLLDVQLKSKSQMGSSRPGTARRLFRNSSSSSGNRARGRSPPQSCCQRS